MEEVRILNKGYDRLFEAKYETDTLWESTTRPPANSLRLSRFFGRTATSTKGMKKVSKKWQKLNKKKKKTLSKKDQKNQKEKEKVKNMSPEERKKYMEKQRRKAAKEKAKQEKAAALEVRKQKRKLKRKNGCQKKTTEIWIK